MKLIEFARLLRPHFVADWYHEFIASYLERCAEGDPEVPNLLISTPPGAGKTELISIMLPAWLLAHDPSRHIISLANSDNLARMASANVLRLVQHPEFQARWPHQLAKASEGQWTIAGNDGRPSMHAAGIGGQITGHRAHFLSFDDLLKSQSDAYSEVVRERTWADFSSAAETRLLPGGKVIGVQTRWHLSDVIGLLLRRTRRSLCPAVCLHLAGGLEFRSRFVCSKHANGGEKRPAQISRLGEASRPALFLLTRAA